MNTTQRELERLLREREERGETPIASHTARRLVGEPRPTPAPRDPDEESQEVPFATHTARALAGTGPFPLRELEPRDPAFQRFVRGVGRGTVHPVRSFIDTEAREDLGLAGMVGEFSGAALTFVPLYRGATFALRGVGLLKQGTALGARTQFLTPFGMTPRGVRTGQAARGGLAFAGFETFAGESPVEAPQRFVRGMAEGVAFEAAAIRIAQAWRARRRQWRPTEEIPSSAALTPRESEHVTDPLRLKMEYAIRGLPSDSPELRNAKARSLEIPDRDVGDTFVDLIHNHMRGGQGVLTGVTAREVSRLRKIADDRFGTIQRPIQRVGFDNQGNRTVTSATPGQSSIEIRAHRRVADEDLFDVWVVDLDRNVLQPRTAQTTVSDVIDELAEVFPELGVRFPDRLEDAAGRYAPSAPEIFVATAPEQARHRKLFLSTMFHEIHHHITQLEAVRRGLTDQADLTLEQLINIARRDNRGRIVAGIEGGVNELREELRLLQRLSVALSKQHLVPTTSLDIALKAAQGTIRRRSSYYDTPHELFSWGSEMLFLNPEMAMGIAPNAMRLLGNHIERKAPTIRHLMSDEARTVSDVTRDLWRSIDGEVTILAQGKPSPTPAQLRQFERTGWADGMRALRNGKSVEMVRRVDPDKAIIRDLTTGQESVVPFVELQRPSFQRIAKFDEEAANAIDGLLDANPREMPIRVRVPDEDTVRSGIVDTSDFEFTDLSIRDWIRQLPENILEQLNARFGTLDPVEIAAFNRATATTRQHEMMEEALRLSGRKGIVRQDNGVFEILVGDMSTVHIGEPSRSAPTILGQRAALPGDRAFFPDIDDWLTHQLRSEGVPEADLDHFMEIARARLGERLRGLMDTEVRQVEENVRVALQREIPDATPTRQGPIARRIESDTPEQTIERAGLEADRLPDGRTELRDGQTKSVLGRFADEDQALDYARELTPDNNGPILGDFPGASMFGGGGKPPRHQDPKIPSPTPDEPRGVNRWLNNFVDGQTLFAPVFSALENFARASERRGFGPAYTRVYLPAHNAMLNVHRELSEVARDGLGGLTFKDMMSRVGDASFKVNRKRHPTVVGHIEALTKNEIAEAGGLMPRAMTANEVRVAQFIESAGLSNDVPRLMSIERLVEGHLRGRLDNTIERMRRIELSEEAQQVVDIFTQMPRFRKRDEIYDFLTLTAEERQVIKVISDSVTADKDRFSIYAVSRLSSAPELKRGFRSGREQYAFENGMTEAELALSSVISETLEAGFREAGLDPRRHLNGYWPHLRKWTEAGFVPNESFLPKDVVDWTAIRYRSGELNVYETDPVSTVYRHLRGLFMKRHFDPVMPEINQTLAALKQNDPRVANTMQEYVLELMGKPHASFDKLQGAIERLSSTLLGRDISDRFASNIISGLSATISSAVIPFRPALIARNFYESLLKVAPRTGVGYYFKGLQYVVDPSTRKQAFREALDAGAIRPGTQRLRSVHASEDLFGPGGPAIVQRYNQIFDKGFQWYQSADDWGRAIAHHSQKMRYNDHLDSYVRGRIGLDEFMSRAKVNMYDPLDVERVRHLTEVGDYEQAVNHLGQVLSRETMTRYGYADHPAGWNSVTGRLFGQFGTWPVQYKDYLLQGVTRGSAKDRAEFVALHSAITGGTIAAGGVLGVNLQNWTGMSFYTGGPFADLTIDVVRSINGSDAERQLARSNLYGNVPVLGWMETGNPRSVFLPGSYMIGDMSRAGEALLDDEIYEGVMSGLGFRVLRPDEDRPLEWLYGQF